jgi:hypothetical protein
LVLTLMLAPFAASGADQPGSPGGAKAAPSKSSKSGKSGKSGSPAKNKSSKTPSDAAGGATAHAKVPRAPKQKVVAGVHPVSDVQVTPFPSHAAAAQKALAQNRRDSLQDAEKAARAEKQDDRWQTVLFHLREFDARTDAEACFWRVLAYYRLGEMARARNIRQLCTLGSKEEASLDTEDGLCGTLQPASALPEMLAAGERPPEPVANPAPYAGAPPTRIER